MQFRQIIGFTGLALASLVVAVEAKQSRPNILFVLTDDQDAHMTDLEQMPAVQKQIVEKGTTFERHYCTVALCCPSRVNIWTGQMAHNTNVTSVSPPFGGYPKVAENGYHIDHLAAWLQESGYNTYYTGKLYNSMNTTNYDIDPIQGYNQTELLLDPYTYQYYNISSSRNSEKPKNFTGKYSPDFTAETAYEFLEEALGDEGRPWFLTAAPIAPHAEGSGTSAEPPQSAERHKDMFKDYKIPRTDNFNPKEPSGVAWVSKLSQLNETVVEWNDEFQRQRLRSLQAVDEMVERLLSMVEKSGQLDNTHIIFSADNGYHISQHRLHPGKMLGMEEDIKVPFVWRGPGVPSGESKQFPTSHSDLAPTILKLADLSPEDHQLDGLVIQLEEPDEPRSEHVQVEYWGPAVAESFWSRAPDGDVVFGVYPRNTYKGLRIEADDYGFYYSVWCTDDHELYDMKADPGQLSNLLKPGASAENTESGMSVKQLVNRLDALTMVLKQCKGRDCTHPWEALHPEGDVRTLSEAMASRYDGFYESQPKNKFEFCNWGHWTGFEGPQEYYPYGSQSEKRSMGYDWSFWE